MTASFDELGWTEAMRSPDLARVALHQRGLIDDLLADPRVQDGDPEQALGRVTEMAARVLRVGRVGLWAFDAQRTKIVCVDLYVQRDRRHVRGNIVQRSDVPKYFDVLEAGEEIVADDAYAHPATQEFAEGYLPAYGVGAMLDTPIRRAGKVVGVLCAEHLGPMRRWQPWECLAAAGLAEGASQVMREVWPRAHPAWKNILRA